MEQEKKRYWLKLDKDFLKSPHIKIIKSMPNGKDYIIFYLALMLESVETVGHLKFNNLVPYTTNMLSALTDTNIDIVKSAVNIFESLGLIQILEDKTIYMTQVAQMTGKECESADRVRKFRENQKTLTLQCNGDVTKCNDNIEKQSTKNKEEEINNSIEEESKRKDISLKKNKYGEYKHVLLTKEEIQSLKSSYSNYLELITYLDEYIEMKGYTAKSHYLCIKKWVLDAVKRKKGDIF